jgi:hypothetical protein
VQPAAFEFLLLLHPPSTTSIYSSSL